jgi:subtilisin family serine protease
MKYIVVRRRALVLNMRNQSSRHDFPFQVSTEELTEKEALKRCSDNDVRDVFPVIKFQKVKPVSGQLDTLSGQDVADGAAWGVRAVGALRAGNKGENVTVAVLDTGIDRQHPAFLGIDLSVSDFTFDERGVPGIADDEDGHGTHVAATIFGRNVDGVRIGVAPGVTKALVGKVICKNGASFAALKSALDWALNNRADIVCLSLGVDFPSLVEEFRSELHVPEDIAASRVLEAYRKTMYLFDTYAASVKAHTDHKRGALLVAASGNESRRSENPLYTVNASPPAAGEGFISVGAIRTHGQTFHIAPFSNTGAHFVAPGVSILSARTGGGLVRFDGTSMAAPHVAGVSALWIAHEFPDGDRPARWADRIRSRLEGTTQKIEASFSDAGYGLVRAPQTND